MVHCKRTKLIKKPPRIIKARHKINCIKRNWTLKLDLNNRSNNINMIKRVKNRSVTTRENRLGVKVDIILLNINIKKISLMQIRIQK